LEVDDGEAEEDTPLEDEGVFSVFVTVLIVIGDTASILDPFVPMFPRLTFLLL
jgi:hypothetical protein